METLESMGKMILYWKFNSKTELEFYGIDQKKNTYLSNEKINICIAEVFTEMDDEEYNVEPISTRKIISSGEVIPEDNCHVIIESIWIDKFVDLTHRLITDEIGNILQDILDDKDENIVNDEVNNSEVIGDNMENGRDVFDYNINNLIDSSDNDNNGGNDTEGESSNE